MQWLAGYTAGMFKLNGVMLVLAPVASIFILMGRGRLSSLLHLSGIGLFLVPLVLLLPVVAGVLSFLAGNAVRKDGVWARILVGFASLLALPLLPFGTLAGGYGIYWCVSRKARETAAATVPIEHEPKAGDGTRKWIQRAIPVIAVVVYIAAMQWANWWGHVHGLPDPDLGLLSVVILLTLCDWVHVYCHEAGHIIAGWAVGMKVERFVGGPIEANRTAGKWKFRLSYETLMGGGGVVQSPTYLGNMRQRMAWEVAGGPIASLLTGIAAFALLLMAPGSAWEPAWPALAFSVAIAVAAVLLNLVPFQDGAAYSDGAALIQILKGGPFAEYRETMKSFGAVRVSDLRPRDIDPAALARSRDCVNKAEEGVVESLLAICAVDRRDFPAARHHLESVLRLQPTPDKAQDLMCAAELALYMAYLDGNAGRAGPWLNATEELAAQKGVRLAEELDYWFARFAVCLAAGLERDGDEAGNRVQQILLSRPNTGLTQFERELFDEIRRGAWIHSTKLPPSISRSVVEAAGYLLST